MTPSSFHLIRRIREVAAWVGPSWVAFVGSLVLSFVALQGSLINRDGILYINTAHFILNDGLSSVVRGTFDWPFFPILIAALSRLSGLGLEVTAHVLDALLLAGACSLMVAITSRRIPGAAWASCLAVLAMPAYNGYRDQILREYGFWFFSILSIWLAMRWEDSPRWRDAILCQLSIALAALFRLEAIAFYPALMAWQLLAAPAGLRLRRAFMIGCLPISGTLLVVLAIGSGLIQIPARIAYYLEAVDILRKVQTFSETGRRMSDAIFEKQYSREEAGYILFFGLLSVIPVKFMQMSGVLLVPLVFQFSSRHGRALLGRLQPLAWLFIVQILLLVIFMTHKFFLTGRYVSTLNLLAIPAIAAGLMLMMSRFPRWRPLMIVIVLATMASNVLSFSQKKGHFVEAGNWLAINALSADRTYVENPRVFYYAGWRSTLRHNDILLDRQSLTEAIAASRYDLIVLDVGKGNSDIESWLMANQLHVIQRFPGARGDAVIVVAPAGTEMGR